jgi:C1A family cysteine protease
MKAVYALSLLAAAASALTFKADPFWKAYKATYGKTYESEAEEARRYEVFNANMQKAAEYNALEDDAEYGMTPVSDRFPEELYSATEAEDLSYLERAPEPTAEEVAALPTSFDSRSKGWIPAVRNQGSCGSCWAFSAAATLSGTWAKAKKKTPPVLSEQQFVDCDTTDSGCNGGLAARALAYAKKGVMLNSAYGYTAKKGTCKYSSSKVKAKVSQVYNVGTSVSAMKTAVYNSGIISVRVNASKLHSYKNGIMSASSCPASPNHAVNVVGWGKSGSTAYWIVRNSWGSSWGEKGYFRLVSGKNACGVEGWPVKVTVV